jgi:hypothetical protein
MAVIKEPMMMSIFFNITFPAFLLISGKRPLFLFMKTLLFSKNSLPFNTKLLSNIKILIYESLLGIMPGKPTL